jgi:hypothetical protein
MENTATNLIALEDDLLEPVAGGCDYGAALEGLKSLHFGNINIDVDINTQVNIINFIGNTILANGPVQIQLGQAAQA